MTQEQTERGADGAAPTAAELERLMADLIAADAVKRRARAALREALDRHHQSPAPALAVSR